MKIQLTVARWRATIWGHCRYAAQMQKATRYNYAGWDMRVSNDFNNNCYRPNELMSIYYYRNLACLLYVLSEFNVSQCHGW